MDAHVVKQAAELAHELAGQATTLEELKGVMRTLMKSTLERMLNTELEAHRDLGKLPLEIPCDRHGSFAPQLVPKHQRRLPGFDEKILALYAKGMTTRDIQELVKELYFVEVSPTLVSEITADLDEEVKVWQTRRLEAV